MPNDQNGMRIPVERLLATIGRLTVENEMLRELVAKRATGQPLPELAAIEGGKGA